MSQNSKEMFPGVAIAEGTHGPSVYISDHLGEVASWSFEQIMRNPQEWSNCLYAVMLAAKMGASAARKELKDQQRDDPKNVEGGRVLCCNVCNSEFALQPDQVHRVMGKLGQKRYCEYQCSKECNQVRVKELVTSECGEDLIQRIMTRIVSY